MSDSVQPHRRQPTRLPHPWGSPGKTTGVSCHCLLQCIQVKSESEVTQSFPTLSDPTVCSLPGSSVHGIFQARILEWGAIAFSTIKDCCGTYSKNRFPNSMEIVRSPLHFILTKVMTHIFLFHFQFSYAFYFKDQQVSLVFLWRIIK